MLRALEATPEDDEMTASARGEASEAGEAGEAGKDTAAEREAAAVDEAEAEAEASLARISGVRVHGEG